MSITERHSVPAPCPRSDMPARLRTDAERCLATFLETSRVAQGEAARDEIGGGSPLLVPRCAATVYCPSFCEHHAHRP